MKRADRFNWGLVVIDIDDLWQVLDYSPHVIPMPHYLLHGGREEREECLKMHSVMGKYNLHGSMR